MMKSLTLPFAVLALSFSVAATAQQPTTRSQTHEGPRATATHTVTRDVGVRQADTVVTRNSDGATATGSRTRTRTDSGSTLRVDQTGFGGQTRSVDATRNRATGQPTRAVSRTRRPR